MPITGGYQCGAARYESDEPPTDTNYCHCRICQRISGAPVVAAVTFSQAAFRFTRLRTDDDPVVAALKAATEQDMD